MTASGVKKVKQDKRMHMQTGIWMCPLGCRKSELWHLWARVSTGACAPRPRRAVSWVIHVRWQFLTGRFLGVPAYQQFALRSRENGLVSCLVLVERSQPVTSEVRAPCIGRSLLTTLMANGGRSVWGEGEVSYFFFISAFHSQWTLLMVNKM